MLKRTKIKVTGGILISLLCIAAVPSALRRARVNGYEKRLRERPEVVEPELIERMTALVHDQQWSEAASLINLLRTRKSSLAPDQAAEILLYGSRAYLELGETDRARESAREAKEIFKRNPQVRVRLETRDPELFWKIGYFLREPGG
jgi:hypothetical protein